jgi:hypothetical protein
VVQAPDQGMAGVAPDRAEEETGRPVLAASAAEYPMVRVLELIDSQVHYLSLGM